MFGQSQCSVSTGQSEQAVLVGSSEFVENEAFERGGEYSTYNNVQYLKIMFFFY